MSFKRTKAQVHDLEDRNVNPAGLVMAADGAGGFYLAAGGGHATGSVVVYDENTFIGVFDEIRFIGAGVQAFNSGSYAAIAITGSAAAPGGNGSGSMVAMAYFTGGYRTSRTYYATSTWETDIYATGSISVDRTCDVLISVDVTYHSAVASWEYYFFRMILDGAEIPPGTPNYYHRLWQRQAAPAEYWYAHQTYKTSIASGTHVFCHQNQDGGAGHDRVIDYTFLQARAFEGGTKWVNFD